MAVNKYWENETPVVVQGEKSVAKVYVEAGKIQAFPVVPNAKYGIGKGATIDLETMEVVQLMELRDAVNKAIENQLTTDVEEAM